MLGFGASFLNRVRRPPIIHEDSTITNHHNLVRSPTASQSDIRLHSQISLFIILTRIYQTFGPDVDVEVADGDLVQIERFNADIESWRRVWEPRLGSVHLLDASGCPF